jgi:Histone-like transcription factor (CBF/NF-Y) and archaeal histone
MNKDDNTDLNELTDEMHDKRLEDSLSRFWETQNQDMAILEIGTEQDFKNHNDLPLARIKRIMKSDEDVRMISAEGDLLHVWNEIKAEGKLLPIVSSRTIPIISTTN